jgi:WD40 repeat protein
MKPRSHQHARQSVAFAIVSALSGATWGQSTPEIIGQQQSHAGTISALAVSPTGDRVVAGSYAAIGIRSWACADGAPLGTIPAFGPVLASTPDGPTVAAAVNNSVYLWEIADGTLAVAVNVDDIDPFVALFGS